MSATAVIIGASGGIGAALADCVEREGYRTIRLARSFADASHIDLENEATIAAAADRLKQEDIQPDIVLVAAGLLHDGARGPEKSLRELDPEWLLKNYAVNTVGPALVAKHMLPLMPRRQRAIFAAIGARVGSISDNRLGGWYGYRAAKAALHMTIRNISIEWARRNDQSIAVALHPGTVDTALSAPFQANVSEQKLFAPAYSAESMIRVLDGLQPADSGQIFAWDGARIQP